MNAITSLKWIIRIAATLTAILGITYWITHVDIIAFHMLLGSTVAISMIVLGLLVLFQPGTRILGIANIIVALTLPMFGMAQSTILIGNLHWLIQSAHLLYGIAAASLASFTITRYTKLKHQPSTTTTSHTNALQNATSQS